MGGEWNFIHSPPIFRAQSCLTDAVIVIFPDYCFTDTHLNARAYLLAALFNAPSTTDNHYTMQVNHDLNNFDG